jgi:cellobiose phosphorylase
MTGTAAWMWKVAMDWILGVRAEIRGLMIDPCIPAEWDSYKVVRRFRRATYEVTVENPDHVSHGVREIYVDGMSHDSYLLPVFPGGETHQIRVVMGEPTVQIEMTSEIISEEISMSAE